MRRHDDRDTLAVVRKVAAEALQYPDQDLLDRLPTLRRAVEGLPERFRTPLSGFLGHAAATSLHDLQQEYVATFDMKRKCCLYLSYYLNGDTRRRGMALVAFKDVYRRAGLAYEAPELPDFLPVVLEFAAVGDAASGQDLLIAHRRGLEVLALALSQLGSPYEPVVAAVLETLPPPGPLDLEAASLLAVQGPPSELVGLEPFGPPETTGVGVRS
ncbi:MAG: nitrate reductase molybdenum cofactor assembly chaperone [Gemmatimonadota bacterium]|nr:nitrate reductase molybdenum cofactor assembly chaperone [Gemmatimonadota bacterium]MDH4353880.1 nitrate reductase molybdenum cofactor assembly chaperone [Actinomycetota bacterium]